MKKLIALILISTQAFAGLPPTSTKGQSDAGARVKFQFQAPHNQFTDLGGVKTLIETGNGNILPDPGFEALTSGWTASGGATATANSTAKGTGAKGYDWDSNSAGQTLVSTSVTIPNGYKGKNGFFSCNIKTVSGTATHTITVNDGTNDIATAFTITSSTTSFASTYEASGQGNFIYPSSGTIRIKLTSVNANEPEIYVDDCKIVLAEGANVGSVQQATIAATTNWVGAANCEWTHGATQLSTTAYGTDADCTTPSGANLSGLATAPASKLPMMSVSSLPPNRYEFTATGFFIPSTNRSCSYVLTDGTNFYPMGIVSAGNSTISAAGNTLTTSFLVSAPLGATNLEIRSSGYNSTDTCNIRAGNTGFDDLRLILKAFPSTSQQAVSSANADYDWTSYTPTFTGFGTVTSPECQHSRVASNLLLRCKFTNGTPTAVEARVSLPNSLVSADTVKIPSISVTGYGSENSVGVTPIVGATHSVLIEPSVGYVTFGFRNGSQGALTKTTGSSGFTSSTAFSFIATIPIQGWSSNQRAPTLVGSVTSNSASAMRFEATTISNTGTPTLVTQSSSWINSLTDNGTGDTTVNFVAGTFSSPPWCTCSSYDGDFAHCSIDATTAISSSLVRVQTDSNGSSAADRQFILMCIGPR